MNQGDKKQQCYVEKRRGRPEKKKYVISQPNYQEIFSIHDRVFHASILFYTYHVFDSTPGKHKFNPTIGFSIYQKIKSIPSNLRDYYDDDQIACFNCKQYVNNHCIKNFYINSLTFGPKCIIDQFYKLFNYILSYQCDLEPQKCINFIEKQNMKFINFNGSVLQYLDVKNIEIKQKLNKLIQIELLKLFEILIHTLKCLKNYQNDNNFADILEKDDDLFQRGTNNKPKKKNKIN